MPVRGWTKAVLRGKFVVLIVFIREKNINIFLRSLKVMLEVEGRLL